MIVSLHPTGNAVVRQQLRAFEEADWLREFWTCLTWPESEGWERFLPRGWREQGRRRRFPGLAPKKLRAHPWREVGRFIFSRLGCESMARHETGPCSVDAVYHSLSRRVARRLPELPGTRLIFAPEDGALEVFQTAAPDIIRCYELPTGYWKFGQRMYREEAELWPEWRPTLRGHLDSPGKLARKDAELAAADLIIVASRFTQATLSEAPASIPRVVRIPFGCAAESFSRAPRPSGAPLRVLFVGALDQRKGLTYLFDGVEGCGEKVALTVIGSRPLQDCAALDRALSRHRWISSLPHAEILREMSRHDVLVFPSLFEGFGLVIVEALSQGLPVITTAHTAGPDVLTEGVDGFIVPLRDPAAISSRLALLAKNPDRLEAMSRAALAKAGELTWARYRLLLREALSPYLEKGRDALGA
jgi:glycosyltransferase involved in cell wall biosynthesis